MSISDPVSTHKTAAQPVLIEGVLLDSIGKLASGSPSDDDRLLRFALQAAAIELHPAHAVGSCLKAVIPGKTEVEIWRNAETTKAYYQNLVRCKAIWVCPLCANNITMHRRNELVTKLMANEGFAWRTGVGDQIEVIPIRKWFVVMVTYTLWHNKHERCSAVVGRLKQAYKRMWGGRWAVNTKQVEDIKGTIRAFEVTHGNNGWHPHIHQLLIFDSKPSQNKIEDLHIDLWIRWEEAVNHVGGFTSGDAFDVREGDETLIEYVNKFGVKVSKGIKGWGVVSEITRYPVKQARLNGATLWELLARYINGSREAGRLWIEAQEALKGTAQLQASTGLWELLGVDFDRIDDDTASEDDQTPEDMLLATLSIGQWRAIVKSGKRGELLQIAQTGDKLALEQFVRAVYQVWGS